MNTPHYNRSRRVDGVRGSQTPIVLLVFNRPEHTRRVLNAVRAARPAYVAIVADGPRRDRPEDFQLCAEVKAVISQGIDWPCRVEWDVADENLGCARRVSSGLTALFHRVEQAIILEDDCVPDSSFFDYCSELLELFADDPRVGVISGSNFQRADVACGASYYFSIYPHCWGWATWRRAWKQYDAHLASWPRLRAEGWLREIFPSSRARRYWTWIFDQVQQNQIDSWAYRWTYTCWKHGYLTALPRVNLVENIGFDAAATHTTRGHAMTRHRFSIELPLRHPVCFRRNKAADLYTQEHHFNPSLRTRLIRRIFTA